MRRNPGRSTGIISTARVTHATPAACYAHTADRDWESDKEFSFGGKTLTTQNFRISHGSCLNFATVTASKWRARRRQVQVSSEGRLRILNIRKSIGERLDGRDLTQEWLGKYRELAYVWNKAESDAIDPKKTTHLLGLFEPSYMQFDHDRPNDKAGEPSLSEMASKAIDVLSNNKKGFFLMVEGGRIDHGHHNGNAYRAPDRHCCAVECGADGIEESEP